MVNVRAAEAAVRNLALVWLLEQCPEIHHVQKEWIRIAVHGSNIDG